MTRVSATCLGGLALAAAIAVAIGARDRGAARAATPPPLITVNGVVAADNPLASQVGASTLARGGNAVDAAAATALALGVVSPASSGIGGGGFALVYVAAEKKVYAFDFREIAPAGLTADRFVVDGALDTRLSRVGGLAVGVPGEVAGLEAMVRSHGAHSWRRDVAPAQDLAARGFEVGPFLGFAAGAVTEIGAPDARLAGFIAPDGTPIAAGQTVRRPELADTLARIGREGAAGFYRGPVAADIVATVRASGGVMTEADLAGYQVAMHEPLLGRWRGMTVATMPLPSSGGVVLLEALGILEATGVDLAGLGAGSSASHHLVTEVLKHAFADRARFLGDADPARLARGPLLDPARLARLAKKIDPATVRAHESYGDQSIGGAGAEPARGQGTSHLCAIDRHGNAVALTTTVNGYFGAQLMTPGGVVLNNEVDDFSLQAGVPNMFGLVQSEHNLVAPGKRPLSSMSPTLVLEGDRVVACVGGSGGPRIISNTLQVLLNYFVFRMDAAEAVGAARVHHQWLPDKLVIEDVPADVVAGLRQRGHTVEVVPWRKRPTAVQAVFRAADGRLQAASDPRKYGAPAAER